MLEGKTFFGATGMPMWKIALVSTRLAVWLPEPLTVAAWMVRSLMICWVNFSFSPRNRDFTRVQDPGGIAYSSSSGEGRYTERAGPGRAPVGAGSRHGGQADRGGARSQHRVGGGPLRP